VTDSRSTMESLAARVVDGESIDWAAAERACGNEQERGFVRNLRIVTDIARHSASEDVSDPSLSPTLDPPPGAPAPPRVDAPDDPGLAPGMRWGNLAIVETIGKGGFGHVYRARDTFLDRTVALKVLCLGERIHEERALADGRAMARVRHQNVVTVHGAERIDDRVGIWMDYIDGQTLDQLIQQLGPFGTRDAAWIGIDLCGALAAVHKAGLVHSDVKAQNVMKEKGGRLVLMDFGAARQVGPARGGIPVSGTPLYMPPEVFDGHAMTVAGDIYALGVLLYHLVTRSFPVYAETLDALRAAHARGAMTLLRDTRPDLAGGFVRVVEKALCRNPADRFATMGQMQQALEAAIQGEPSRPEPPALQPAHSPPTAWRPAYAALAAAVLVVAALAIWLGIRPDGEARTTRPDGAGTSPASGDARQAGPASAAPGTYAISAALYRSNGESRERLVPGARIRVGDKLFMDVEISESVHVYVLNHDQAGDTFTLFPRADCDLKNPLPPGRHRLPGRLLATSVDQDWQVDTAGGREQVLILASRTPLDFVEKAIAGIPAGRQSALLTRENAILLRGIGSVAPSPTGGASSQDAAILFEDIKRLADTTERASGTWMRQIDLENPPTR